MDYPVIAVTVVVELMKVVVDDDSLAAVGGVDYRSVVVAVVVRTYDVVLKV